MALMGEKQVILRRQQEEVSRLMQMQVGCRQAEGGAGPWTKGALGPMQAAGAVSPLWS